MQSNLNAIESEKMAKACDGLGISYKLFKLIPFLPHVPRIGASNTEPFVLIGSTTLNINALKSRKYRRGIWFNKNFAPTCYAKGYGADFLNHDQQVMQIQHVPDNLLDPDTEIFIRSDNDSKQISGGTVFFRELLEIKANTLAHHDALWTGGDLFSPQSEIVIASVKNLYAEYRLIVMDQQIIGASMYRPTRHYSVPQDIIEFAKEKIQQWKPHVIHTLDIAETDEGPKVIECNCVNGAGWYEADYGSIIWNLNQWQITNF